MRKRQAWSRLLAEAAQPFSNEESTGSKSTMGWSFYSVSTVGWILGTVIIGAIGSGLWDWVLSDTFAFLGREFLQILAYIFSGYVDVLHRSVGSYTWDRLTTLPWMAVTLAILFGPWALWYSTQGRIKDVMKRIQRMKKLIESPEKERSNEEDEGDEEVSIEVLEALEKQTKGLRRMNMRLLAPAIGLLTVLTMHNTIETMYTRTAASFIERSIEILAPYLSPDETLALKSQYRMVEDSETFNLIYDRLLQISSQKSVRLPEFSPVR